MVIFSGVFSMVGLAYQCMWLVSLLWKISLQPFVYHLIATIPLTPWPLSLPKWQWYCPISLHVFLFFLRRWIVRLACFFVLVGFAWLGSLRWFYIISGISLVFNMWYFAYIWYHLYNLKNVKNTHGRVLILVKLQVFTKSNTPPWMFLRFFNLYKWYQITLRITIVILW